MEEKKNQIVELILRLRRQDNVPGAAAVADVSPLTGDGSQRRFFRVRLAGGPSLMAVLPPGGQSVERGEVLSAWHIGRHLFRRGVPVPEPLARDEASGLILFEDLGDTRLYDLVRQTGRLGAEEYAYYRQAVHALVHMQVEGVRGFDVAWCWQTPRYDRSLMLERESGYFLQALCRDLLKLETADADLRREFEHIAARAGRAPTDFFLHRDFQSRNLMIQEGKVRIIDFQGGRLGPLAYDLASLLFDPYVSLPVGIREALFDEYLAALRERIPYDPARLRREYNSLALQRLMQALGAFAFLGGQMGKTYFLPFLRPALHTLRTLLEEEKEQKYPLLLLLVEQCREKLDFLAI